MLKAMFLIISGVLAFMLSFYKLYLCKQERTPNISVYVSIMTGLMFFYILITILYGILAHTIFDKVVLILIAMFPFVIGKYATYEKEKLYCWIQIFVITLGIIFVLI